MYYDSAKQWLQTQTSLSLTLVSCPKTDTDDRRVDPHHLVEQTETHVLQVDLQKNSLDLNDNVRAYLAKHGSWQ